MSIQLIRSASSEEIESIRDHADLTSTSSVWSWPSEKGQPDIGVIRHCTELDPVFFGETSGNQRKALFFWAVSCMLKATGIRELYFNIDADAPEEYKSILAKLGAQPTTSKPQIRYKLHL